MGGLKKKKEIPVIVAHHYVVIILSLAVTSHRNSSIVKSDRLSEFICVHEFAEIICDARRRNIFVV